MSIGPWVALAAVGAAGVVAVVWWKTRAAADATASKSAATSGGIETRDPGAAPITTAEEPLPHTPDTLTPSGTVVFDERRLVHSELLDPWALPR